jgi:type 1 glutamine amidotransferase
MNTVSFVSACLLAAMTLSAAAPKKVLVVTATKGFRHSSIATAENVIATLGETSGAFTVVDYVRGGGDAKKGQDDSDVMEKMTLAKLAQVDAVIFANTTGDLPLPDKEAFIAWVKNGGAFVGMHSASDTFHPFRAYIDMLQGEFETHKAQVPADLIAGDKAHPANAGIGATWDLAQEEMYIIKSQDRSKVRSLWFMRHHPNDAADQRFFPVSWCRKAGEGKWLPTLGYGLTLLWTLFWALFRDGSLRKVGSVYARFFFTQKVMSQRGIIGFAQFMNRCVTHWHFYKFTREATAGRLRAYNTV